METINNIYYPILDYIGFPQLEEHPKLKGFFEKVEVQSLPEKIKKELADYKTDHAYIFKKLNNMSDLPIFAIRPSDMKTLGEKGMLLAEQLVFPYFGNIIRNTKPQIIPKKLWDDAFEFERGFNNWLKKKEKSLMTYGLIIRPEEKVSEFYSIIYNKDGIVETTVSLYGKNIDYFHVNCNGYISKSLNIEKIVHEIAKERKVPLEIAYFQEDIYNILKLEYYKEASGLKPKLFYNGDTIRYGSESYTLQTETPCISYELTKN